MENEIKIEGIEVEEIENIEIPEYVEPRPIGVYVKRDVTGRVVKIDSELFIDDLAGWEKIDEGFGDRFAHAQSQYKI